MNDDGLRALREVRFDWALMEEDVWAPSPFHVDGLHETAKHQMRAGIDAADSSAASNPIGLVVEGDKGTGKTHLLGWAREEVQARGGYFFLVGVHEGTRLGRTCSIGVVNGLLRPMQAAGGDDQLRVLLRRLADWAGVPAEVAAAVAGDASLTPAELDVFAPPSSDATGWWGGSARTSPAPSPCTPPTTPAPRWWATASCTAPTTTTRPGSARCGGCSGDSKTAELTVRDSFRLLALTGPSVVAVDQIDGLLATSLNPVRRAGATEGDAAAARLLDEMATGLMGLHNAARRSLTVVACLASSWTAIPPRLRQRQPALPQPGAPRPPAQPRGGRRAGGQAARGHLRADRLHAAPRHVARRARLLHRGARTAPGAAHAHRRPSRRAWPPAA